MIAVGYVVLHYCFSELTRACLGSLARYAPDAPVLVVDNGSPEPFRSRVPVMRLEENRCLAAAMNAGSDRFVSSSAVDVIVQLNNDVLITSSTHPQLARAFADRPRLGIAAPVMDQRDAGFMYQPCSYPPGRKAESYLASILPREKVDIVPFVDNTAFAIRRQTWEQVGGLEERFTGASWGANYDYCWRANQVGWETGLIRSAFVFHRHRATWNQLDPHYAERASKQMLAEMHAIWGDLSDTVSCRAFIYEERKRAQAAVERADDRS